MRQRGGGIIAAPCHFAGARPHLARNAHPATTSGPRAEATFTVRALGSNANDTSLHALSTRGDVQAFFMLRAWRRDRR